ncbi:sugar 3,4-ketoisomerase [Shewanella sp.]|uniref:sugar 3,4-ketoisomerase n=1 Tax=Shewanella sp. TaxID=50422 RepID=UPI003A97C2DF
MNISTHKVLGDHRGQLIAIESASSIPFNIKRIFYIFGTQPGIPRGNHAHYKTKQYLIAVSGFCKVTFDDGQGQITYDLDEPSKGLLQEAMIWGTMHDFSPDCVLLVLASEHYDENDYIRDYDHFLRQVSQ